MVRGWERRPIFSDDHDRGDFVTRLARLSTETMSPILAWALMPNHAHILLRSGREGLSVLMRRVLTGYAGQFNRRHCRQGHLFQNRFKSILVDEEPYLLELVRYLHLNPVRAEIVSGIDELDGYEWTGHSRLVGRVRDNWQTVEAVLRQFGGRLGPARQAYRAFIVAGLDEGYRCEFGGGGLRRSRVGWEAVKSSARGREQWAFDERVLGRSDFVMRVATECERRPRSAFPGADPASVLDRLKREASEGAGLSAAALQVNTKRRDVVAARVRVSHMALHEYGLPVALVAAALGVSQRTVLRAARAGKMLSARRPPYRNPCGTLASTRVAPRTPAN
jgi:putative transposase